MGQRKLRSQRGPREAGLRHTLKSSWPLRALPVLLIHTSPAPSRAWQIIGIQKRMNEMICKNGSQQEEERLEFTKQYRVSHLYGEYVTSSQVLSHKRTLLVYIFSYSQFRCEHISHIHYKELKIKSSVFIYPKVQIETKFKLLSKCTHIQLITWKKSLFLRPSIWHTEVWKPYITPKEDSK